MGYLKYVREIWKKPKENAPDLYKERLLKLRKEPVTVKLDHPTRPDRARSLGYKAKQGIFVVRQKIGRGVHIRPQLKAGRRPRRTSQRMALKQSYKVIAEQRANKKFQNCEVLNSYWVAEDGKNVWYEVILVDRSNPSVKANKQLAQVAKQKGRATRGKTSAGRKSRGLHKKGMGSEKSRPSKSGTRRHKVRRHKKKE